MGDSPKELVQSIQVVHYNSVRRGAQEGLTELKWEGGAELIEVIPLIGPNDLFELIPRAIS